ncbi:MAG: hypothetical protein AAFV43_15445 [Planctomycetota bacterium]
MRAPPKRRRALAAAISLLAVVGVDRAAGRAPLCPSVLMVDEASWARAAEHVMRASELLVGVRPEAKWVQLVPTLHVELDARLRVQRFGLRTKHHAAWDSLDNFSPADAATEAFRQKRVDQLAAAIEQAVHRGLNVAIVPHLDAAGPVQEWRNRFDFAPDHAYGGASFDELLLRPIVEAIEQAGATDLDVDLMLGGEMGRSWFTHPAAYEQLVRTYGDRLKSRPRLGRVRIGVALNWSGVTGLGDDRQNDAGPALRAAFDAVDFVGFSCYAPVSVPPTADDFRVAVLNFRRELLAAGVDLGGTPIQMSEIAIGGGPRGAILEDIAAAPWRGVGVGYEPWRDAQRQKLRRDYHNALCEFLARPHASAAANVDTAFATDAAELSIVERAYLWSEGPWDPQGVQRNGQRDPNVVDRIRRHNGQ